MHSWPMICKYTMAATQNLDQILDIGLTNILKNSKKNLFLT